MHRQHVFPFVIQQIRQIEFKGMIAAEVRPQSAAVEIHGAMGGHALEQQPHPLFPPGGVGGKMPAIPGVFIMKIALRTVVFRPGALRNDIIMGQTDLFPRVRGDQPLFRVIFGIVVIIPGGGAHAPALGFGLQIHRPFGGGIARGQFPQMKQPAFAEIQFASHKTTSRLFADIINHIPVQKQAACVSHRRVWGYDLIRRLRAAPSPEGKAWRRPCPSARLAKI